MPTPIQQSRAVPAINIEPPVSVSIVSSKLAFSTPAEVNLFFDAFPAMSELERLSCIRDLEKLGDLTPLTGRSATSELRCPIYKHPLVKPCSLSGCHNHIPNSSIKNCVVHHLGREQVDKISNQEIADLLNLRVSDVKDLILNAIKKIRVAAVRENIEKFHFGKFEYIQGHCLACELDIREELELGNLAKQLHVKEGFAYCSEACLEDKPAFQSRIELDFGHTYKEVIYAAMCLYSKVALSDPFLEKVSLPAKRQELASTDGFIVEMLFDLPKGLAKRVYDEVCSFLEPVRNT